MKALGTVYPQAFSMNNIVSGIKVAGTFLFYWFTESDFLVSYMTDHPIKKNAAASCQHCHLKQDLEPCLK
jgi:hypothetical protein